MKIKNINLYIFSFLLCLCCILNPHLCYCSSLIDSDSIYVWSQNLTQTNNETSTNSTSDNSNSIPTVTSPSTSSSTSPDTSSDTPSTTLSGTTSATLSDALSSIDLGLESQAAILIEQNTGKILYEKNIHEQLRPASVTKVMSLLLFFEALDSGKISLDSPVPCSEKAASMGGSQIWLDTRETLSVNDMLKAVAVNSANDCCTALAEFVAGSTENFVAQMNQKAKELGMNDTCFKNCHGLDEDGHVTSAYDIAIMSKELLLKHPSITNYTTIWTDTLRDGKSELANTNKLIRNYSGATGLKTGSTSLALYNLSASATRDGLSLIAVIMKAPSTKVRFSEAEKLLDYGFNNYSYQELATASSVAKNIFVNKGVNTNVNAVFKNSCGAILPKGSSGNIEQIVSLETTVEAPVTIGQKLGEISFVLNR